MRHENSVFHALTKHVPWPEFDRLVGKYGADHRVRRLKTKSQFVALLFGQLAGAKSLREIEAGLSSHEARLYHLGAARPARSTLADANATRPWQVFADLFAHMVSKTTRSTRRHMADVTRVLDATKIKLPSSGAEWGRFSESHCAAKLHLVYDPDTEMPLQAVVTPDNVNDITPAKAMEVEAGATYVFDLAYYDYGWWADLDAQGCRIVTRLKINSPVHNAQVLPVPENTDIVSDCIGHLSQRMARSRRNPFQDPVREIIVRIDKYKTIRLVTNDLDAPAEEIADLYKQRWQIELFFKWIKQNLKIRHVLGTSQNAVRIQLFVALIAYMIIRLAQTTQTSITQPLKFARLVRLNLMHRRPIDKLDKPNAPPPIDRRQMSLELSKC